MDSQPNYEVSNKQRSLPIPKQVNFFILDNYGDAYYSSSNSLEKQEILKKIENQCIQSGYENIRAQEIERRFKNMKSHYRRKKLELEIGTVPLVVWEYFGILDRIFKNIKEKTEQPILVKANAAGKRAASEEVKEEELNGVEHSPAPQDLSKRPRKIIEFCNFHEISDQIPVMPPSKPSSNASSSSQSTNNNKAHSMVANIRLIDQQRLEVNRQLVALETYRCQLDTFGAFLNQELTKLLQENHAAVN